VGDAADVRTMAVDAANQTGIASDATAPKFTKSGLSNAVSNVCLAALFLVALLPGIHHYASTVADVIWAIGAALMGLLSLVRVPPKTVSVNARTIAATAGMMLLPTFLEPSRISTGAIYNIGVAIEVAGVVVTQIARITLGRRFGLLPANRGIVSSGPFRLVRHPIYSGWLILTVGYVIIYASWQNILITLSVIPFMIWRISQEETHLSADPGYREYMQEVPYRVLPFII
jgi:protein-S-isoprenylcysteine O-methyltransferase Ste14